MLSPNMQSIFISVRLVWYNTNSTQAPQMTCIELLLDHGSSLTTKNTEGHLPIQCVIMSPHSSIHAIDMLLEHDPDQIDVVDSAGNGLLHHARGQKVTFCIRTDLQAS